MFITLESTAICNGTVIECFAWSITTSVLLLLFALFAANAFHAFHWHFIPESCVFITIGVLFSGMFVLFFNQDQLNTFMNLNEPSFILLLLPPIIFEGGYSLKKIYFVRNFGLILALAIVGTAMSAVMIGVSLYLFSNYTGMEPQNISVSEAMSVGSLLSATDPVAALAVYSSLGVDKTLFTLVYGESNLNDAIGIVFFRTFRGLSEAANTAAEEGLTFEAVTQFFCVTILAPIIGIVTGLFAAVSFKIMKFYEMPVIEIVVFWCFSYLSYLFGEVPGFSGIISTLFCGFVMRHYAYHNLSPKGKVLSFDVMKYLSSIADTVIFINLGFSPLAFAGRTTFSAPVITVTILLCLISRAISVASICFFINFFRKRGTDRTVPVTWRTQIVLFYAGLRGAVAFVLAIEFIYDQGDDYWLATTLAVIFFTVYVLGGTTALLLKIIGIEPKTEKKHSSEVSSAMTEVFSEWERKWIAPWFVRKDCLDQLVVDDGTEDIEDEIRDIMLHHDDSNFSPHYEDKYHSDKELQHLVN